MEELVTVSVTWRGSAHEVALPASATLRELAEALASPTGAAPHTLRLLLHGRALALGDAAASTRTLRDAGLPAAGTRPLLLGATRAELHALSAPAAAAAAADQRVAPPEHAAAVAARRRGRASAPIALPSGEHVFASFRALRPPPGAPELLPSSSAALRLLHRLAADPGIAAVMTQRRWRVGLLSEMPPEGLVGVSESCVLGYNVNRGQEIALRLRTDDWRGFRKYESIRVTLIHELAHMVHGPHELPFKMLNSELTVQAANADWTRRTGRTLGGGGGAWEAEEEEEEEDTSVMGLTLRDSGRALGGAGVAAPDAAAAAAQAAQRRAAAAEAARAEAAMAAAAAEALAHAAQQQHEADRDEPAAEAAPEPIPPPAAAPVAATAAAPAPPPPPAISAAPPPASAAADVDWAAGEPELTRLAASAEAARSRAVAATAALAREGSPAAAETALRTLASVLRNVLAPPPGADAAARYRILRRCNAAFEQRAGRFAAARELLRCAGFQEERDPEAALSSAGGTRLRLAREDPGLLWLALGAVNDALEARAAATLQPGGAA